MGPKRHGVKPGDVIAVDAAYNTAANQSENVAVSQHDRAGTQGGKNAVLDLVEKIRGIHQGQREARDSVFGEKFVDITAHKIRTPQAAGLHSKTFGFEPFLQQGDLRGTARAVHPFNHDEAAGDFAGIESDQRLAKKILLSGIFRGRSRLCRRRRRGRFRCDGRCGLFFFLIGHAHSVTSARGAKRLRSILEATMSRICFCNLLTGIVPSRTTKLSVSTILSYSSRMRAWNKRKLSARS